MKKLILSLACLIAAVGSYAAKTAKAVVSTDEKTITFYYDEKDHSAEGTSFALNEEDNAPEWWKYNKTITTAVFDKSFKDARPTSLSYWFGYHVYQDGEIVESGLTEIKGIENLNTSKTEVMYGTFTGCTKLKSLDLSSFNTDNLEYAYGMFQDCTALESLDLSSFNTEKVWEMAHMFRNCRALKSIDLSSFNIVEALDMDNMFHDCAALETLDLSSFNTENVISFTNMFKGCKALKTIYVSERFVTTKAKYHTGMFDNCTSLVGGAGTTFNSSYTDATYARIDHGTSSPGYFSSKTATSISGIKASASADNAIYNLAGQKVDGSFKGIVIKNGMKMMQK